LTTFRETLFENYNNHKDRLVKFKECIPILHHSDLADDNTEQLSLAFGWLRSKSWVRLQHLLLVHVSNLWKYGWHNGSHAYDQRLKKESFERLMCKFGMEGDEYECAETLVVTARSRLRELARREAVKLYEKYRLQSEARRSSDASPEVEMYPAILRTNLQTHPVGWSPHHSPLPLPFQLLFMGGKPPKPPGASLRSKK
jgi:hypothetical protein